MDQNKIGKFIAKLRKDKNMTQEELAEKLGVNSKSVSRWENGNCMPDLSLLIPLSKELDVNVNDLVSGKKNDKNDYQETFEENIVNIVSKVDKDNKKRKIKTICISLFIVFILIPLIVLCLGQFLKIPLLPGFSSFEIMDKANQFYRALQDNDIDMIDKLMTNNVEDEMCWWDKDDFATKQNFLDNLEYLKNKRIEYTSLNIKQFYYAKDSTGSAWEVIGDPDDPTYIPTSTCSWPSRDGFIVVYELCFKDWADYKACISLTFQLDDNDKLIFMTDSKDINLNEKSALKKYYPIWYPASISNAFYNKIHVLVTSVFYGFPQETVEENVNSWGTQK